MKKLLYPSQWIFWGLYKITYRVISTVSDTWKESSKCWLAIIRGKVKSRCHLPAIKIPWEQNLVFQQWIVLYQWLSTRDDFNAPIYSYSVYLLTTPSLFPYNLFYSSHYFNKNVFSKFTNDHHIDKYDSFSLGLLGSILSFPPNTGMSQSRCSRITSNLWLKFYLLYYLKTCSFSYVSDFITLTSLKLRLETGSISVPVSQPHFTHLINSQVY